jgi:hypothetical protein
MTDDRYVCRVDDAGNYRKIPTMIQENHNENTSRLVRLECFPPKIPQSERDFIFGWCELTGNQRHFVDLLFRAEQRAMQHRHFMLQQIRMNQSLAARDGDITHKPVSASMLNGWVQENERPPKTRQETDPSLFNL